MGIPAFEEGIARYPVGIPVVDGFADVVGFIDIGRFPRTEEKEDRKNGGYLGERFEAVGNHNGIIRFNREKARDFETSCVRRQYGVQ